ncbi:MAG: S-layer glycoprotein N-glycosyltransferase AglJ [Methanoregulaceae archaeon]|nr:S-layer glycoprotein N-glycosyltransferase AglJ [Methanoregulaceae archaeon]
MPIEKDLVRILIPTLNEAPTIREIIESFRSMGYNRILVIDGNSRDDTRDIARDAGAEVRIQQGKGKGDAIIEAFEVIEEPFILMLDGDGTYDPGEAEKLLVPLVEGYDQVIGNRLVPANEKAFSRLNLFGNQILNRLFKMAHSRYLGDILSGYRAFRKEAVGQMHLTEKGFGIETEISAEAVHNGQKIAVLPISYVVRPGTHTKLSPFHDGLKIMTTIYRLARMNNPLFYFGLIGVLVMVLGFVTGVYIIIEWFNHVDHLPLTVLTVLLIVVGFQVFMFGIISDMILSYHRDLLYEIQHLKPPK